MVVAETGHMVVEVVTIGVRFAMRCFLCVSADGISEWGGGGGLGGGFRDDTRRGGFDEYNAGDDEIPVSRRSNSISTHTRSNTASSTAADSRTAAATPTPAPAHAKEVDLLGGFMDDDVFGGTSDTFSAEKALPALGPPPPASIDGMSAPQIMTISITRAVYLLQMMNSPTSKLLRLPLPLPNPAPLHKNPTLWTCSTQTPPVQAFLPSIRSRTSHCQLSTGTTTVTTILGQLVEIE
jgi:epsin